MRQLAGWSGCDGDPASAVRAGARALLLGIALILAFACAPALAGQTHTETATFGGLTSPIGLAVDNTGGLTDGNVYVADFQNSPPRVVRFSSAGSVLATFEGSATPSGNPFIEPYGVGVDESAGPTNGNVYVADIGNANGDGSGGVYRFLPNGTYAGTISAGGTPADPLTPSDVAVQRSTGNVYVSDYAATAVKVFDSSGTFLFQRPGLIGTASIEVADTGNYIISNGDSTFEFDATRAVMRAIEFGAPHGVALDHVTGHVFVGHSGAITEYDGSGTKVDEFNASMTGTQYGVGVDETTHRVYATDFENNKVHVFSPAILPDAGTGAASAVGSSTATVSGTVDPAGGASPACEFEYGTDATLATASTAACSPAGPYSSATGVSAALSGLDAASTYYFRIHASNANGSTYGSIDSFTTDVGAPTVGATSITERDARSAIVATNVNPRGFNAGFRVEYGPDTSYGSRAPVPDKDLHDAGITDVAVRQPLFGLTPGTIYHYRVVATNAAGETRGPDRTFRTMPAPDAGLPDGRVYELVSPARKNGYSAGMLRDDFYYGVGAANGGAVAYRVSGAIGAGDAGFPTYAVSRRSATGWTTQSLLPRAKATTFDIDARGLTVSDDLRRAAFADVGGFAVDAPTTGQVYVGDVGEPAEWVSRPTTSAPTIPPDGPQPGSGVNTQNFLIAGGSSDLSTLYFAYRGRLLPEDDARTLHAYNAGQAAGFYRYRDGRLTAAGVLPDGTVDPFGAVPAGTNILVVITRTRAFDADLAGNQVSRNGERAFFVSPDPGSGSGRPSQLYVRDGDRTLLVSRADATGTPAPTGARRLQTLQADPAYAPYAVASPNGRYVVFASQSALTADAPAGATDKLYRFDVDRNELRYLEGVAGAPARISDDGRRIVYLTTSQTAVRLWDAGAVSTLLEGSPGRLAGVRDTAAGDTYVFVSNITPAGVDDPGGHWKAFRWHAGDGPAACVSCADGNGAGADAYLSPSFVQDFTNAVGYGDQLQGQLRGSHELSDDGRAVFFTTAERLSARDINGVADVYQWRDGRVSLLSSGRSNRPSYVIDSSPGGGDVFFTTADGLVSQDTDGNYDIYDARVGGGFDDPAVGADCALSCQATGGAAADWRPATGGAASGAPAAAPRRAAKPTVKVVRKSLRGTTLAVTLRASGAGVLSVSGTTVATTRRTVSRAGAYVLHAKLTAAARKSLRRRHRLAVRLRVSFTPATGRVATTTSTSTLKGRR